MNQKIEKLENQARIEVLKAAIEAVEKKAGIEKVVAMVNAVYELNELPVGEYRRYAHLLADLVRMLAHEQKEYDLSVGRPVDEETGRDTREWSGNSIEADHAEALVLNDEPVTNNVITLKEDTDSVMDIVTVVHGCTELFELYKSSDGSYSWKMNLNLKTSIKEELPAFYSNRVKLDQMLDYLKVVLNEAGS